jgi:hypothetical protein
MKHTREWRYKSTHPWPPLELDVRGQLHALTFFIPRKEFEVTPGQEAECISDLVRTPQRGKILPIPRFEAVSPACPTYGLVGILVLGFVLNYEVVLVQNKIASFSSPN